MARDPLSSAAENVARTASVSAELARQNRQRRAYVNANKELFGVQPERPVIARDITSPYQALGISAQFARRAGIFPHEMEALVPPVRTGQGGGGGAVGFGTRRPRGRRGGPAGLRDPLQIGQIFAGGPISAGLGLRAGGLATLGVIGAGLLAFDAGLRKIIQSVQLLNNLYQNQVKILQPFSAALTAAQAQRNLELTLNRFRLAQQSGPALARTFRAETRFRIAVENSLNEITTTLAPLATFIFETGAKILEAMQDIGVVRSILTAFATALEPRLPGITLIINRVLELLEEQTTPVDDSIFRDQMAFFAEPQGTFMGTRTRRPAGF